MLRARFKGSIARDVKAAATVLKSVNVESVVFDLDASWEDLLVWACFRNSANNTEYHVLMPENRIVVIPWEIFTETGHMYVGAVGYRDSEIVKPTTWLYLADVVAGVNPDGDISVIPTPTAFEQAMGALTTATTALNTAVENIPSEIDSALEEAKESGEFDGPPGRNGQDGYSPVVTVTSITGGHRVTITDEDHPDGQSFDVMDGTGGGGSNIIEYGTGTNAQIEAFYQAEQMCACIRNGTVILPLIDRFSPTYHVFSAAYNNTVYIAICQNNEWRTVTRELAKLSDIPTVDNALSDTSENPVQNKVIKAALDRKYEKPQGGIPGTDLAETYLTQHQSLAAYRTAAAQDAIDQQIAGAIPTKTSELQNDSGYLTQHQDISGKLDKSQGVAHAGEFCVVGSDGNITTVTMTAWQGGSY